MLITVAELRRRIASDSVALVSRLQEETGRYGSEEAQAWESSLSKLSRAFEAPSFQPLHLFFSGRGNLALEYQMPAASSWADVVLLGRYETAPAAVIIELKDWSTAADRPGKAEGLIDRAGRQELHPSDQVRGYTEYVGGSIQRLKVPLRCMDAFCSRTSHTRTRIHPHLTTNSRANIRSLLRLRKT